MRVLIYRLGSLGDIVVALPALHKVRSEFADAEIRMLTNFSVSSKAAPIAQILDGTGLVDSYLEYPLGLRRVGELLRVRAEIRRFKPDVLIYLAAPRGRLRAWRDAAFFRACGIKKLIGIPYSSACQRRLRQSDRYEYEGARLLRCIESLGEVDLTSPEAFDLHLNARERDTASELLARLITNEQPVFAASVGTKVDVNDWGDANWSELFERVGIVYPNAGLVMLGAGDERQRSEALLRHWPGARLNLCGTLTVRESAAVLEKANLFIGHDSGPMHLSAAVGTPCVAIFSARDLPGIWYPYGKGHRILYHPMPCQGCLRRECRDYDKACILAISVESVYANIRGALGGAYHFHSK